MSHFYDKLRIGSWNIDGMFTRVGNDRLCKLDNEPVSAIVSNFNIMCLMETHCSTADNIQLPGFRIYQNIRPKSKKAKKHLLIR